MDEMEKRDGTYITLTDDDGQEAELEFVMDMEYNGSSYSLFLPADMDENDEDYGYIILRMYFDDKENEVLYESIDDEDEEQDVFEKFMVLLEEEEEPEEK